jgi:hypothetical protein
VFARVQRLLVRYKYVPPGRPIVSQFTDGSRLIDLVFTALDSPHSVEVLRAVTSSPMDVVVSSTSDPSESRPWPVDSCAGRRNTPRGGPEPPGVPADWGRRRGEASQTGQDAACLTGSSTRGECGYATRFLGWTASVAGRRFGGGDHGPEAGELRVFG